jgi:hypothetical protein
MTQETENLRDVVDEYLHWRKVNPHIKGGENYLQRLSRARIGKGEVAILGVPNTEDETCPHCGRVTLAGEHHAHPCAADSGHPDDAKPVEAGELALALQPYCFDGRAQSERAAQSILARYHVTERNPK